MEGEALPVSSPVKFQRHTKRSHCVEDSDTIDLKFGQIVSVPLKSCPTSRQAVVGRRAIICPSRRFDFLAAILPPEKTRRCDVTDQRPRGIGAARETEHEYLVTRLVVEGEKFVGAPYIDIQSLTEYAASEPIGATGSNASFIVDIILTSAEFVGRC